MSALVATATRPWHFVPLKVVLQCKVQNAIMLWCCKGAGKRPQQACPPRAWEGEGTPMALTEELSSSTSQGSEGAGQAA